MALCWVSDDLALRDTAALICRARGLPVETVGTEFHAIFETVQKSSSTLRSVLIDLDPVLEHMKDLRAAVKGAAPGAEVIGMTVFAESPDAGCRRDSRTEILGLQQAIGCELRAVIDKTELVTQLQCLVNVR